MCSAACPCDLTFSDEFEKASEWFDILTNDAKLKEFDRCLFNPLDAEVCDPEKAIIMQVPLESGGITIEAQIGYDI